MTFDASRGEELSMLRCLHDSGGSYTHISTESDPRQSVLAESDCSSAVRPLAVSTEFAVDPEDLSSVVP